ncbi:NUDIX domain-containing protein [Phenylobacterium sp.]|uniref:NUDIX hydrolase n=1 Tax=Phenylobacterium sp. TaxID=1871053 RepID=UPI000C8F6BF6|nr:NUDIX domain-containing protein [Phenylobacterium sp.]MAK81658.1 NUDIX hydrolase [Phenylobacterium sp.]
MTAPSIHIVAAVLRNHAGCVLTVRKAGTSRFMLPGGKREPGEDDLTALARELREELGIQIRVGPFIGRFHAPAANEPGRQVVGDIYMASTSETPAVGAEIAELLWISPQGPYPAALAPLLQFEVLPRLTDRNL